MRGGDFSKWEELDQQKEKEMDDNYGSLSPEDMGQVKSLVAKLKSFADKEGCDVSELIEKAGANQEISEADEDEDYVDIDAEESAEDADDEAPKGKADKIALIVARMKAKNGRA